VLWYEPPAAALLDDDNEAGGGRQEGGSSAGRAVDCDGGSGGNGNGADCDVAGSGTSTSAVRAVRAVPIGFMSPDEYSVLCGCCTAAAGPTARGQLRDGVVLRPLSQFPGEAETLLPPLCMLQVVREGGEVGIADGGDEPEG
jgi:hypothetical protein